jgi:hypothetical protein
MISVPFLLKVGLTRRESGQTMLIVNYKAKGKVTPLQAQLWPIVGVEVWLYSSKTLALERGEGSASCPGCTSPLGKTRYLLYRSLGGPQGRSGQAENLATTGISSPDCPTRSQSLYRLSYPAHNCQLCLDKILHNNLASVA